MGRNAGIAKHNLIKSPDRAIRSPRVALFVGAVKPLPQHDILPLCLAELCVVVGDKAGKA